MPRPTRFYSKQQEMKVAKSVGGKRTANSGATAFSKGDVNTKSFLIECKTCVQQRDSMSVKRSWLDKNREEAFAMNKDYSALALDFGDGEQFYIIDERLFKTLINYLEGENDNGNQNT